MGPSFSLRTDRHSDSQTDGQTDRHDKACYGVWLSLLRSARKTRLFGSILSRKKKRENVLLFQALHLRKANPGSTVSNTAQFPHITLFLSFSYFRLHAAKVVNYAVLENTQRSLAEWSRMSRVRQEMRTCNIEDNTGLTNTKGLRHVQCPCVHIWILSISISI